jgi:pyruvate dehydrogenase E2 component (dihydrolipoamide acetyltransferase)
MNRMRKAIARNMNQAKPGMPHIYVTAEADMAAVIELRKQINESGAAPVKISVNDMVMKAVAKALVKFPILNASYTQDEKGQPAILYQPQVNVCVAVALEDGLVAPVVKDTDKKSVGAISAEIKDMAARAREGKIKQEELDGGTFTVSNLGMYDVVEFGAIITSPQAGILAVGAVREIPVVKDGEITIGQRMYITVSADHRLADGAIAAQFVREVKGLLEAPMGLLV